MLRWEYKTLRQSFGKDYLSNREDASFDRELSDLGAQGWELMLVQPVATYNPSPGVTIAGGFLYVFRKPVES